jgi:hypothetical protein
MLGAASANGRTLHKPIREKGTVARLRRLTALTGDYAASPRQPRSPARFILDLRRVTPQLRIHGISFTFARNHYSRILTVERINTIGVKDIDA